MDTSHEYVLLRIRNISDKICGENQNSLKLSNVFFPLQNRAVYEIMWKDMVKPDRTQLTIKRAR